MPSSPLPALDAPDAAATPRRRRKLARPQELLEAALALFVEKGFAATRAEEVAARAGVSKGTLYLYFPSKEDLLKAVISTLLGERIASGALLAEQFQGSIADLLRALLVRFWGELYDAPVSGVFKLIIAEVRNFPDIARYYNETVIESGHQLLARIVQRGIDRGEFRAVQLDCAVHSLILPLVMLCVHRHSVGACGAPEHEIDGQRFIAEHVELILAGLAATARPLADAPRARRKLKTTS